MCHLLSIKRRSTPRKKLISDEECRLHSSYAMLQKYFKCRMLYENLFMCSISNPSQILQLTWRVRSGLGNLSTPIHPTQRPSNPKPNPIHSPQLEKVVLSLEFS